MNFRRADSCKAIARRRINKHGTLHGFILFYQRQRIGEDLGVRSEKAGVGSDNRFLLGDFLFCERDRPRQVESQRVERGHQGRRRRSVRRQWQFTTA